MRQTLLSSTLALALAGLVTVTGQSPAKPVSAEPTAFQTVTAKLDPGGSLYAYVSTDKLLGGLSAKVEQIRDFVLGLPDLSDRDRGQVRQVFGVLDRVIRHSGIEAVNGLGVSGIAVEPGLYRTRFVVQRVSGTDGYIWRWFGREPGPLEWLDGLPSDTVYAASFQVDLAAIWTAVLQEARAGGVDPVVEGMGELSDEVRSELGVSLENLLGSLEGTVGIALRLDREKEFQIPLPGGDPLELPEPALMIALKVKNDGLFDTLSRRLQEEAPEGALVTGQEGEARWLGMKQPLPAPFPVQPILAAAGGYLWLSSTPALLEETRQVRVGENSGLKGSAEFQRLSRGLPTRGNSFGFVSERLGTTLQGVQEAILKQAMQGQGARADAAVAMLLPQLSLYTQVPASYAVGWFDGEGAQSVAQGGAEPVAQVASAVLVAPTAMFAGMLLPALSKAKDKAQEVNCMNNMKQILIGLMLYSNDNDDRLPTDLGAIKDYVGRPQVMRCPMDPRGTDGVDRWEDFDPADCSYEYLTPGIKMTEVENPARTVVLRCKYHGHEGFLDGHVERGR